MAPYYRTTAVPFDGMRLPDLRDPVLAGMGTVEEVGTAADQYRTLADTLEKASEDLRAAMNASQGAHEGDAAAASRHYVMRLAAVGDLGAAQSRISMDALFDGVSYYTRVRDDMAAMPRVEEEPLHDPRQATGRANRVEEQRVLAVEAMQRYESNSNWALERSFQPYEPEPIAPPGAIGGGPVGGAGVGGVGGSGVAGPAGGAGAAGGGTGVAASEFVGPGAGAGSVGIGAGAGGAGAGGAGGIGPGGVPAGPAGGAGAGGLGAGAAGGGGGVAPGVVGPGGVGSGAAGSGGSGAGGTGRGGAGPGGIGAGGGRGGAAGGPAGPVRGPAALRPASEDPDARGYGGRAGGAGQGRYPGLDKTAAAPSSSGWVPGTPWSSRPGADGPGAGGSGAGGPGAWGSGGGAGGGVGGGYAGRPGEEPHAGQGNRGGTPTTGPGAAGGNPPGRGPAGAPGYGGTPMMGAGGAGQQGETHTRPSWLLEDDPEAFWFKGMPEYGPPVIGGDDDY